MYTPADVVKLLALKELLYEKGYTLDGALRYLDNTPSVPANLPSSALASFEPVTRLSPGYKDKTFGQKLRTLRDKLTTLRELL
ncbi:hypothetical protein H0W26_01275 [Candidatus Dependentiae bacterium]|nr:hypothetical protein [Candidatus Dependentiae bacterium]